MPELLELSVDGQPLSALVEPGRTAPPGPARRPRPDRHEGGLRRLRVRRVHGPRRRPAGELVLLSRAPGRGPRDHDRRGPRRRGRLHPLQRAFLEGGGIQCGFCTPGMLISAVALLARDPDPSEEAIRDGLAGNLCRCTGYQPIIQAVQRAAAEMRGAASVGQRRAPRRPYVGVSRGARADRASRCGRDRACRTARGGAGRRRT